MKLTLPQIELLLECPTTCVRTYKPGLRLQQLGLAHWPVENSDGFERTASGDVAARALSQDEPDTDLGARG